MLEPGGLQESRYIIWPQISGDDDPVPHEYGNWGANRHLHAAAYRDCHAQTVNLEAGGRFGNPDPTGIHLPGLEVN